MRHLDDPSSGVESESLLGVDPGVRGYEGVPGAVALPVEEQSHVHSGIAGLDEGIVISDGARILDCLGFDEPPDDVRGGKIADGGVVFGLAHLNHDNEIAPEVAAVDEPEHFGAGEPAVAKKIVEADALRDALRIILIAFAILLSVISAFLMPTFSSTARSFVYCAAFCFLVKPCGLSTFLPASACMVPSSINWVFPSA